MQKTYNIFISHSWSYSDAYEKLTDILRNQTGFQYKDYSVPKNDPIHNANSATALREAIRTQMSYANVILIMAGKYATYSRWINEEIHLAKRGFSYEKPVLAITPWGAQQISTKVRDNANLIVGWKGEAIVKAVKQLSI